MENLLHGVTDSLCSLCSSSLTFVDVVLGRVTPRVFLLPSASSTNSLSHKIRRMSDTGEQHASVSIIIPSHASSDLS